MPGPDHCYDPVRVHLSNLLGKVAVALVYQGWDAAGKGGNIRRLTRGLDPRGYEVIPIAAPNAVEKAHRYLWRFWKEVPKAGHITIFDRSWYGRLLVERVEGFCAEEEWKRAFREINEFERQLTDFVGKPGFLESLNDTDGEFLYFTWREDHGDLWVMDVEK